MECRACSVTAPEDSRFCQNCGAELPLACPSCHFVLATGAKFCGGCGLTLRPTGLAPAAVAKPPLAGWGELKQATVLFSDIDRSTEQIANLDPEAAMDRLQPAVLAMCEAVERFNGTVVRTLGDGVMALFGVPIALEGHATLACEAALQMRNVLSGHAGGLTIRVGLHSGLVASDPHAADKSKGGGAHGLTIHLASRVSSVAPPGQIALTADCHALLRGSAQVKSLGWCPPLKGIPGPVEIFLLENLVRQFANRRFQDTKLTPLRGRNREMSVLKEALARAQQGGGNVVGVTGAAGTGKSRLCFEFGQWCGARAMPVFGVHAQLYGHATPLQPALDLLRVFFFQFEAGAEPQAARDKVSSRMAQAGIVNKADTALVHEFLGIGSANAPPEHLHAATRRSRLLNIVRDLFEQLAMTPSVLIIEDLHWLDEASEEFVSVLVKAVAGTRVLLVLNYRSSYVPSSTNLHHFQKIELAELSVRDTTALVRELVSNRRELSSLHDLIARRSGGNPFFAEELVQSLVESGILSADAVASRSDAGSIDTALPSTVQAVIAARIDRLEDGEKSLLQTCAIVGKSFPLGVLELVTGSSADALRAVLDRLYHAQLIQPAEGTRHFGFRHALIQEVAYSTQLKARRSQIHASVARALERYYEDRLDEFAGLIAYHHEAAGRGYEAASYLAREARWVGSTDSAQAIKHWHKARLLLRDQPQSEDRDRLLATANSQISLLGWREGLGLEDVRPFIEEAMDLASRGDPRMTQLLLLIEGRMLQAGGGPADLYIEKAQQALALVKSDADVGRTATINAVLCQAYGWAGLLRQAIESNDLALANMAAIDKFDREFIGFSTEQWVLGMRCRLLTRLGRFDEARGCLSLMVEAGKGSSDPLFLQMVHYAHIDLAWCLEDTGMAEEHAQHIGKLAEKHTNVYLRVFALHGRGLAMAVSGRTADALQVFREALDLVRTAKVAMEFEPEILASIADSCRASGNHDEAVSFARQAVELSRGRGTRLPHCRALITLASALAERHGAEMEESAAAFAQAEHLLEQTGSAVHRQYLGREKERIKSRVANQGSGVQAA